MTVEVSAVVDPQIITPEQRLEARRSIKAHVAQFEMTCMDLGRLLWLVSSGRWYQEWGHETFEDYLDKELGFALRRARYHISVWQTFGVELGVPSDRIQEIGWFKAGVIAPVVTADNLNVWLERARTTSAARLQEEVRRARELVSRSTSLPIPGVTVPEESAAPAPAADVNWSPETDTNATTYVDNPADTEIFASPKRTGDALPPEDRVSAIMKFPLFEAQHATITRALDAAGTMVGSTSRGHQLDTICTLFLSGLPTDDLTKQSTLTWVLQRLEAQFNISLIALPGRDPADRVKFFQKCLEEAERDAADQDH